METWPTTVPAWLMGLTIQVAPILSSITSGYRVQRRAFDRRDDIMDASLSLTAAEFAAFETFVQTDLNQGADQFTGPYYDGDGYRTTTLQMVGGQYAPTWNGSHFDVTAQVQIFNRRDSNAAFISELIDTGISLDYLSAFGTDVFDALEDAVNNNNL